MMGTHSEKARADYFFFSSRRRHTRYWRDWSSDVCSSDLGLSNLEAFAANAFFTAGMVIFEVPTGVVADTVGRRASYLLGTLTLSISTVLYWLMWVWSAPFWAWAVVSEIGRAHV